MTVVLWILRSSSLHNRSAAMTDQTPGGTSEGRASVTEEEFRNDVIQALNRIVAAFEKTSQNLARIFLLLLFCASFAFGAILLS